MVFLFTPKTSEVWLIFFPIPILTASGDYPKQNHEKNTAFAKSKKP
jgi:hypothetical protein